MQIGHLNRAAKVWPLQPGVEGYNASGQLVILQPGVPGFMEYDDAIEAQTAGRVDLMAGKSPADLRSPQYQTRVSGPKDPPPRRAEPAVKVAEVEETKDDEPPTTPDKVSIPARKPAKTARYKRRDVQAEKP